MSKKEFYRLDEIQKKEAQYNILLGERANGKSFAVKEYSIREAWQCKKITFALIRRYEEDIKANLIGSYFNDAALTDIIKKITDNQYNAIYYYQRVFYFATLLEDGKIEKGLPCGVCFALSADERYKSSTVYPDMRTIIFEEFTTKKLYLASESDRFMNIVSTILRLNTGKVFMIANKVSRVCPYFTDWGLRGIPTMKSGQIDTYDYLDLAGNTVKIAVEMCATPEHKKAGMFFGRTGKSIEGGAWETKEYPHLIGDLSDYYVLYEITLSHMNFMFNILLLQHKQEDFICTYIYPAKLQKHDRLITEEYQPSFLVTPTLLAKSRAESLIADCKKKNKIVFPSNLCGEDFYSVIGNMKMNPFTLQ